MVGIIVLVLFASLVSVGLWLSVGFNQKEYTLYTVYINESVSGLSEDSPVKYNGVQVGFVKKIRLNTNDPRQVELLLSIEDDIPITTSTFATLISQGITGVTYVGLSAGSSNLTPLQKMPGEPYPVIPTKPSLFNQLDTVLKEVAENVNKVSMQTQRIFNEENARYIRKSLANIDRFSTVIADDSAHIDRSLKNADIMLANVARASKDFPATMKELKSGILHFNQLMGTLGTAGKDISKTMVSGKKAVDKFSQQTLPPAVILLNRLNAISANLEEVSKELRQNPSVVLRGTKPPKPGPGE